MSNDNFFQTDVMSRLRGTYDQSAGKLGEGVLSNLKEKQAEKEKIVLIDEMLSQLTSDDPEVGRAVPNLNNHPVVSNQLCAPSQFVSVTSSAAQ